MRSHPFGATVLGLVLGCLVVASTALGQSVRYVDDDAPAGGDGSSWATAYKYLQDGLAAAAGSGGAITEIRVAKGTYKPDQGAGKTPGDRNATFQLLNGVAIKGGYAGLGAPDPDTRDITANETILSGDLLGNDGANFANNTENSYHVVTASGTTSTAGLDGVTVTAGNANGGTGYDRGGGVYINGGSPTFADCVFKANKTSVGGGGVAAISAGPAFLRCVFLGNFASSGGAVYNDHSSPGFRFCLFQQNSATSGFCFYNGIGSIPVLTGCRFEDNGGVGGGSVVFTTMAGTSSGVKMTGCVVRCNLGRAVSGGPATMVDCLVVGNSAGGVYCMRPSSFTNCTIAFNGRSQNGCGIESSGGGVTLSNSILWGNGDSAEARQLSVSPLAASVSSSCIQGWSGVYGGMGNTGGHPHFVDADGADNIYGTIDDDLRLGDGSPCIDAGSNAALPADADDLDGDGNTSEPLPLDAAGGARVIDVPYCPEFARQSGAVVDIGALEASDLLASSAIGVVYVDGEAAGAGDGTSWADAFTDLQAGLTAARAMSKEAVEIWVAAGTYTPAPPGGDPNASFQLANKLQLYGGFQGNSGPGGPPASETSRFQRNPWKNVTTLSGANTISAIVKAENVDSSVVLDGFTVTGAQGGGLYITLAANALPQVSNCVFRDNTASQGAAVYCANATTSGGTLLVTGCTFIANEATTYTYPLPGVFHMLANANLVNCAFAYNRYCSLFITNNRSARLTNCTFTDYEQVNLSGATLNMTNCIAWGAYFQIQGSCQVAASYSDIRNGRYAFNMASVTWGPGNIDADPKLVATNWQDFYRTGRLDAGLRPDSPCIDAGVNAGAGSMIDAAGNSRFADDTRVVDTGAGTAPIVDMGAYEFQNLAILVEPTELAVPEGATATISVRLDRNPGRLVEVIPTRLNGDADLTIQSSGPLTFGPSNWSVPQQVTFAAAEDADRGEGSMMVRVEVDGVGFVDVMIWEEENDVPSPLYVRKEATGLSDGSSWANAIPELREALPVAAAAPHRVKQVWVAAGTYKPTLPGGDRNASFQLSRGVGVYGGFAGHETSLGQRLPGKSVTTLSGDLNGDDIPFDRNSNRLDNSYVVVSSDNFLDAHTAMDGFTVRGGYSERSIQEAPRVGAVSVSGSGMALCNCTIMDNYSLTGGGMEAHVDDLLLVNCMFVGNGAVCGLRTWRTTDVRNCVFDTNGGYGITTESNGNTLVMGNCTFVGHNYAGISACGPFTITNSIFWNPGAEISQAVCISPYPFVTVEYNGLEGGYEGRNIWIFSPPFVSLLGPDGKAGTLDDDLRLLPSSPCIDAGSNTAVPADTLDLDGDGNVTEPMPFDIAGNPRFVDVPFVADTGLGTAPIVDMGAFEYTLFPDCNRNGASDFEDIASGSSRDCDGNKVPDECETDRDWDGVIDACDNCPTVPHPSQADRDNDGLGDACDNCPLTHNANQADTDADGRGDACDDDIDGDGLDNAQDNCPRVVNLSQEDADGDGVGDACDQCSGTLPGIPVDSTGCLALIKGDFDRDADVDQTDFGHLQACLSGSTVLQTNPACADAILDGDSDVDAQDVAIFLGCLSGENTPADPDCAG